MQRVFAIFLVACALTAVHGRELQQAKFKSVGEALSSPQNKQLSTLLAAVKAAGITVPDNAAYTIFAPTNEAFQSDDIKEKTGLTAAQLLEPKNKEALKKVLQYHIVPTAAVRSTQLKDGQRINTALKGAAPLIVSIDKNDKKVEVYAGSKEGSSADVIAADVTAGKSIIHVIDDVLIPPRK